MLKTGIGKNEVFLVDLVIPKVGDTVSIRKYIDALVDLGISQARAYGSLGGISGRSAQICDGFVTRL